MSLKTRLHDHLFTALESRKTSLQLQRSQLSIESTESGKGSAGDKHEVGIAIAQIEIEKLDQQIALAQQQLQALQKIDATLEIKQVQAGAIFESDQKWFYCSVPFGQINLDHITFFCMSTEAPLFQALKGKKELETAEFNGRIWKINQVF
jgi:multidrug efflux pump subunit AcrA (membrane-fusion protein)